MYSGQLWASRRALPILPTDPRPSLSSTDKAEQLAHTRAARQAATVAPSSGQRVNELLSCSCGTGDAPVSTRGLDVVLVPRVKPLEVEGRSLDEMHSKDTHLSVTTIPT